MCQASLEPTAAPCSEVVDSVAYITVRLPLRAGRAWAAVCRLFHAHPDDRDPITRPRSIVAAGPEQLDHRPTERSLVRWAVLRAENRLQCRWPADVQEAGTRRSHDRPGGSWIVPPFAEAHNHNITGWEHDAVEERNRKVISKYVADGVFYVKIQGSFPLTDALRRRLPINRPGTPDVAFAQTFLTATGGHPIALHEQFLLPGGTTRDWPRRRSTTRCTSPSIQRPTWRQSGRASWRFGQTSSRRTSGSPRSLRSGRTIPRYFGRKALDPALLPRIVRKAHASNLQVSAHVASGADFHNALAAGVDEIVHVPAAQAVREVEERIQQLASGSLDAQAIQEIAAALTRFNPADPSSLPLRGEDARLAARRGTVVITTFALAATARARPEFQSAWRAIEAATLRLLNNHGVVLAVGSDNPADSSVLEADHLQSLGVLDNLTVLKMWTEATPKAIFPNRRIGSLREGYEASFLALEGSPLENWQNVRRIKVRFKQGVEMHP